MLPVHSHGGVQFLGNVSVQRPVKTPRSSQWLALRKKKVGFGHAISVDSTHKILTCQAIYLILCSGMIYIKVLRKIYILMCVYLNELHF